MLPAYSLVRLLAVLHIEIVKKLSNSDDNRHDANFLSAIATATSTSTRVLFF